MNRYTKNMKEDIQMPITQKKMIDIITYQGNAHKNHNCANISSSY